MWVFWLIVAGIFFVLEIITVGFLVFWLGIGALLALIVSLFTSNLILQTAVFVISSIILIFLTKPFTKKILNTETVNTNVFSIIGKKALVIKDIDPINSTGQIKVNGEVWTAISHNNELIKKDTEVEIENINGVKAIVKPINININV